MKLFLLLVALLTPVPVFAFDASIMKSIEGYCLTTKNPQYCLTSFINDARACLRERGYVKQKQESRY